MPAPSSTSTMTTITNDAVLADAGLYRMLAWLSPGFPVGAFSYSHGLEAETESGRVRDRASLQGWITTVVALGGGRIDADILRDAHRTAAANDIELLSAANRRGLAYRATAELALETSAQGEAFLATCRAAWPEPFCTLWATSLDAVCHPAAVGAAMARAGIPIASALTGYLQALAANLVSAGIRLIPLGQTDGQRALASLEPVVERVTVVAQRTPLEEVTTAAPIIDWCSMRHETQYTRLFRS